MSQKQLIYAQQLSHRGSASPCSPCSGCRPSSSVAANGATVAPQGIPHPSCASVSTGHRSTVLRTDMAPHSFSSECGSPNRTPRARKEASGKQEKGDRAVQSTDGSGYGEWCCGIAVLLQKQREGNARGLKTTCCGVNGDLLMEFSVDIPDEESFQLTLPTDEHL